jgi:hypothetical protein
MQTKLDELLRKPVIVINLGLRRFAESLAETTKITSSPGFTQVNIAKPIIIFADGKIVKVYQPQDGGEKTISIFLNIFNVHVKPIPHSGSTPVAVVLTDP